MMKRLIVAVAVLTWAAVALAGVVYLVFLQPGSLSGLSWSGQNVRYGYSNTVLLKEETVPAQGIESIEAFMGSERIELTAGSGDNFVIRQYGREDTPEDGL